MRVASPAYPEHHRVPARQPRRSAHRISSWPDGAQRAAPVWWPDRTASRQPAVGWSDRAIVRHCDPEPSSVGTSTAAEAAHQQHQQERSNDGGDPSAGVEERIERLDVEEFLSDDTSENCANDTDY